MQKVPKQILDLVTEGRILLSNKAQEQDDAGGYIIEDLQHSILHGMVAKKERDEQQKAKYKYTILGQNLSGGVVYSCGKVIQSSGKTYFVISFHGAR